MTKMYKESVRLKIGFAIYTEAFKRWFHGLFFKRNGEILQSMRRRSLYFFSRNISLR